MEELEGSPAVPTCEEVEERIQSLAYAQDGVAMLWDLAEGKRLYSLDAGDIIYSLCFSPNRYWLCAATQNCIKVSLAPPSREKK